jgi:DNA (cytosine-5)-methyltransferase 1
VVRIDCPRAFVSLFGGIGGFDLALTRQGWNCVGYYEIDKYAVQTYNKNFKTDYKPTDITKLGAGSVPDHTLLCGGFPCQAFSIAGKRKGFEDIRGTLFFEIMRIARAKRTPYLLLENVKGLLNHDSGKTFEVILRTLDECGYDAEWQVLNSKDFGVPQNRERVFIVGHLRGTARLQVFPFRTVQTISDVSERTEEQTFTALRAKQGGPDIDQTYVTPTIRATDYKRGDNQTTVIEDNWRIRRLTPTECERLQGFSDGWTAGVSDTQRYKQLGNAVTVNVVEAIAKKINRSLYGETKPAELAA